MQAGPLPESDRLGDLSPLDAEATLELVAGALRRRRQAELDDLRLASHWAALYSSDPRRTSEGTRVWTDNRLRQLGGEGTPRVQEFCLAELAMVRQVHPISVEKLLADVLDLQHRLPLTWAEVESLQAESWLARKVAGMTRDLPLAVVDIVDRAVAAVIATEAPARVLTVIQAKIMEADPVAHAAKAEAERRRRYVTLSRTDEHGLRHIIARVTAGDAVWLDAMLERVEDLIAGDHPLADRDELRSIAMGWLARPADLLALLQGGDQRPPVDTQRMWPRVVVYVHLHEAALTGITGGVARVEGLGPVALERLRELVGHAHITVKPVKDLSDRIRLSCYEHPTGLKERVRLISGGDCFPYSGGEGLGADYDHPRPFRRDGPPGQTGTHNSGPLGRRHHRWKTHAGYVSRQCGDGRYLWRTPHGWYFLVDHRGTRPLDRHDGAMIMAAPDGVDLFVPDIRLDYSPMRLSPARAGEEGPHRVGTR
jgi:hypothetical protein